MKNSIVKLTLFCALLFSGYSVAQQEVDHHVDFTSGMQNMWGPSWNAFSINQTITLFEVNWNESFDTGNSGIVTILGQQFGAAIAGGFSGTIGSEFSLTGFTTGEVEVDYPIDVTLDMPTDLTYDQGDQVTIQTEYEVSTGYALDTYYPSAGEATLDLYFQLAANLSATMCAFGCTTFPVIPAFDTGMNNVNLFTVNTSEVSFFSFNGGTPMYSYAIFPLSTTMISGDPLGEYGLEAVLDLPYVTTTDALNGQDLSACGEDTYLTVTLDVFALLSNLPYLSALGYLSGDEDFGFGTVYWNLFSAGFQMDIHNKQCFAFQPNVYAKLEFPVAVEYTIFNGVTAVSSGNSAIINVEVGNDVRYKFPCYFEELDIVPTYSIDGNFTNHTYDSISFQFDMSAFAFGLEIPPIEITPEINVPEICIPIPYPCPSWSDPFDWCTEWVCTPAFTIPAVGFPGITYDFGPLWEHTIPIGYIDYDWYNNTWDLEGFDEYTFPAFTMIANRLGIANSQVDVLCYGDATGSINVTTSAVSPAVPYTYLWTNGATTQNVSNLEAGPYEVEVYDANGCQHFTGATILEPEQELNITSLQVDKSCNGGIDDGSIDVLVQGGTPNYGYSWSTGATSEDVSGLPAGSHTLTVTDANGCIEAHTVTITEPSALGQVGVVENVDCRGNATGTINVNAFGGTLPYSYSWSSGQTQSTIGGLTASNYTLTITDAKGCTDVEVYAVTEPALDLNLTAVGTDILCKFDATGAIDVTTTGGTAGYSYLWTNSQGIVLPFQSEDVVDLTADEYTVVVTDNNGCVYELSEILTEPAQELRSTEVTQDINCFGDATGIIDPVISGGTAPYSYDWSTGSIAPVLSGVTAGIYSLEVTDANNCTEIFEYELTEPSEGLSLALMGTDVLCHGENTGAVATAVNGGTSSYTYLWSNGAITPAISNVVAGVYSVTVTDSKGCTVNDNIAVNEPLAPLALSSVITDVDCHGNNSGAIDVTTAGGTGPYEYLWSNGGTIIMTEIFEDVSNQYADTYTVLVTDANGCEETLNSTINEPLAPLSVTGIVDDANCFGLNDGGIDITVVGGTPGYGYSWTNGDVTEDVNSEVSGDYEVTITDANLCTLTATFSISQPAEPLVATVTPTDVKCNGGADGMISSSVTGGTMPYSYDWSTMETVDEIYNLSAGAYTLTVTDAQGCTAFTGTAINEPANPLIVNYAVSDVQCHGASDGEIVITITGGVEPYYYNWGNQNEILVNNFSETISDLNLGDYFIRVTDRNGCVNEQYITVNEPQPLVLDYVVTDALCYGDNTGAVDLTISGGTPAYSTTWSSGQSTEDLLNVPSGTYNVLVVDDQLCEARATIEVDEPSEVNIAYEIVDLSCVDQSDAAIFVGPYGGVSPYSYVWSNGSVSQNIEGLDPGMYTLELTDANSCVSNYSFEIVLNDNECVFIPNTFTPNGDDYNDTWVIRNIDLYPGATVKVFNKWGNNVFSSEGKYEPWNGNHNGAPLPSEVYYYIIILGNEAENEYTGTITIIR